MKKQKAIKKPMNKNKNHINMTNNKKNKKGKVGKKLKTHLDQRISKVLPQIIASDEVEAVAALLVYAIICRLESQFGKFIPLQEVEDECLALFEKNDRTITLKKIRNLVDKLVASGLIFIPRKGFVQII